MSASDDDGGECRICGRSALAHPSGACRSCRRGKGDAWVAARKKATRDTSPPLLSDAERALGRPGSWRDRSSELWKRRPLPPA